jgi:copper chaperone
MEVLVFKTNVRYKKHIHEVANQLDQFTDINRWNFDLQDKDKILRVETSDLSPKVIEKTLQKAGYYCEELAD